MQKKNEIASKTHSDFSIEHILNYAGNNIAHQTFCSQGDQRTENESTTFSWLQCTRFCPPKIPRKLKIHYIILSYFLPKNTFLLHKIFFYRNINVFF